MGDIGQPKWEGKATSKVIGSNPQQVWSLLEDFCSLNKYLPSVDTCYKLDGVYAQPGLIRYCSSTVPSSSSDGQEIVKWCHEKLLAVDPLGKCFTYEVTENNIGFGSYFGTIRVLAIDGGDVGEGCVIDGGDVGEGCVIDGGDVGEGCVIDGGDVGKGCVIDGGDVGEGCVIEWSFIADPIQGWTMDGLLAYIDASVHTMAEKIGKILESMD